MKMVEQVALGDGEEGYSSDSEVFSSVHHALDSVRMAPSLVKPDDKDQYDYLLSIVDPSARYWYSSWYSNDREDYQSRKIRTDKEALLTTVLNALTRAVSRIDATYHASLLSNVFGMHIWFFEPVTRTALLGLITALAAVPDKYLEGCLHMLVRNFVPPETALNKSEWVSRKGAIHNELNNSLKCIFQYVPLAPSKLCDILDKTMARRFDSKAKMNTFVECMLDFLKKESGSQRKEFGLHREEEIGDILSAALYSKVINLLLDLDVNITWDDIHQEDQTMDIFDMELEGFDNHSFQFLEDDARVSAPSSNSAFVEKLDGLMVIVCEHLHLRVKSGRLLMDYKMFMDIFRTSVLKLHKSTVTQFVMFYACSLDPENWGLNFADDLAKIFLSTSEDPISRMSAVSYLAGYLSRAKFISPSKIATILLRLVNWCSDYCNIWSGRVFNPRAHKIFYFACQAVMYILCFRMRELMDVPTEGALIGVPVKSFIFDLPLGYILFNSLDPLKKCLPSIVQEFLRQAKAAHVFHASIDEDAIYSELSKAFGGSRRLDNFFPFDPYLLKESDRFIRSNFIYWSMVKTTYSDCSSDEDDEEEDEEFEDLDAPQISSHPIGSFENDYNVDYQNSDGEGDNLEYSLNEMSITPKQTFNLHMPAKIRPSVSPT